METITCNGLPNFGKMSLGDKVMMVPITRHAKNRVNEHGNIGAVLQMQPGRFCVAWEDGYWRWVENVDDTDFTFTRAIS